MSELTLKACTGTELERYVDDLARLRVTVFREYPYLYDGSEAYESDYLRRYLESPECVFVLALDGEKVVGASTAQPMAYEVDAFKQPFLEKGYDIESIFYLAESVLLPEYRGHGLGHRFFDEREAFAKRLRPYQYFTFCAVDRPEDHPLKPEGYRSHDVFWSKRGYVRHPELIAKLPWKEIDVETESEKSLSFWLKAN